MLFFVVISICENLLCLAGVLFIVEYCGVAVEG